MIISCYPGIGKSTLACSYDKVIDLDSVCFTNIRNKYREWWMAYCDTALMLSAQGYTVLISCNRVFFKYLNDRTSRFYIIMYSKELKDYAQGKVKSRYLDNPQGNSKRTLDWVISRFDDTYEYVSEADREGMKVWWVKDQNYSLKEIIEIIGGKSL